MRESGSELEIGDETALRSNARENKKETEKGDAILLTSIGRGKEKGGAILLMRNGRESKREKGKGDRVSLKRNWRMNDREQEIIDTTLATSGEEESKKQQGKTGQQEGGEGELNRSFVSLNFIRLLRVVITRSVTSESTGH